MRNLEHEIDWVLNCIDMLEEIGKLILFKQNKGVIDVSFPKFRARYKSVQKKRSPCNVHVSSGQRALQTT